MVKTVPTYLVSGPSAVVAICTVCGQRTLRPIKAMMDRTGSIITDGCGSCSRPGPAPSTPTPAPAYARGCPPVCPAHLGGAGG